MTNEAIEQPMPVFPNYAPPGLSVADPKQAKPLMKMISKMLRPRTNPRVSHVKKRVDRPRRGRDKVRVL